MFWRSKPVKKPAPAATPIGPESDPREYLAEALLRYQDEFNEAIRSAGDPAVEKARYVVHRARQMIGESGLGPALAPTLLEHIEHWPSWSKREDFDQWMGFPCKFIDGVSGGAKKFDVTFEYNSTIYTVKLFEEERICWSSTEVDMNLYGKAQLITGNKLLLGLDVYYNLEKGDAARWRWMNVFGFSPGPWMKDLIEIAAHIEQSDRARAQQFGNEDALARARGIVLPDDELDD